MILPHATRAVLMEPRFDRLLRVAPAVDEIALKLGIQVAGLPAGVARALIDVVIDNAFGSADPRAPTPKQVDLASRHGLDLVGLPRLVSDAIMDVLMSVINLEQIEREGIRPGSRVVYTQDAAGTVLEVSSITADGLVFFRGGNGRKAWARNLCIAGTSPGNSAGGSHSGSEQPAVPDSVPRRH